MPAPKYPITRGTLRFAPPVCSKVENAIPGRTAHYDEDCIVTSTAALCCRIREGLPIAKMAKKMGIAPSSWGCYEAGTKIVSPTAARKILALRAEQAKSGNLFVRKHLPEDVGNPIRVAKAKAQASAYYRSRKPITRAGYPKGAGKPGRKSLMLVYVPKGAIDCPDL